MAHLEGCRFDDPHAPGSSADEAVLRHRDAFGNGETCNVFCKRNGAARHVELLHKAQFFDGRIEEAIDGFVREGATRSRWHVAPCGVDEAVVVVVAPDETARIVTRGEP